VARKVAEGKSDPIRITRANIHSFLGAPKFLPETEQEHHEVGVATGLAWTSAGGEILYVEASLSKGRGNLTLTGQLGEVMKESAQAAVSYARAHAGKLGIESDFYQKLDIHIHVPAGAIPKDGPSAGITMATALISALTRRPVSRDVAMTGEITLRGRVLPIGGLKEKSLAAVRAGIKTIILPDRNEKDLDEIPKPLRRKLRWVVAQNMSDVLHTALLARETKSGQSRAGSNLRTSFKPNGRKTPLRAKRAMRKHQGERSIPFRPS
jgi:ATP-dependent Lon protease